MMNDVGVETKTAQKSVKIKMEEEVVEEVAAAATFSATATPADEGGAGAGRDEEDPKENAIEAEDTERANLDSLMWESRGGDYTFHPDPFKYSVWPLLFLRLVERSSFYGYNLINPGFLTG